MSKAHFSLFNQEFFWLVIYFLVNLFLTFHNKWILSVIGFSFPWLLTFLHISISGLCSFIYMQIRNSTKKASILTSDEYKMNAFGFSTDRSIRIFLYSIIFTANIAVSNISLNYISLPFHQLVRSSNPFFVILLEFLIFRKLPSLLISLTLIPVTIVMIILDNFWCRIILCWPV